MKTIKHIKYGSPKSLIIAEESTPLVKDNEVLIKVHYASVNPLEWRKVRGTPILVRFSEGLFHPKEWRLGRDLSGTVVEVGKNVTEFEIGDAVFGLAKGSFSEYVSTKTNLITKKPENVSFEEAAAVSLAGVTALQVLKLGKITTGKKILINGASGGVGHFAVQLAVALGAEVTAVCSHSNMEFVKKLGAKSVIDYKQHDYTSTNERYDLIIDNIANHSLTSNKKILTSTGICVIVGFKSLLKMLIAKSKSKKDDSQIKLHLTEIKNKEELIVLSDLMKTGRLIPQIDRTYDLSDVSEALLYSESKRVSGKVIIKVIK